MQINLPEGTLERLQEYSDLNRQTYRLMDKLNQLESPADYRELSIVRKRNAVLDEHKELVLMDLGSQLWRLASSAAPVGAL